ncbi:rRNA maturation RNase YbeY [Candidatus Nomurabacteria bacterium]|nr:rRNA maturation RNase YbeY [Candidatus Kaiserbacteria bacterium]MCB9814807.1 rRNA maturation RNase YbeY [Candidatus Nomurabacteria bacterium]
MKTLSITSTVKNHPTHPYEEMKKKILGAKYELSLAFVGKARAAKLNLDYRQKTYTPNVLSFPLTESAGEIIICPQVAKNEAKQHNLSIDGYIAFLFIHGLLHLKGLDHGDTMDKQEQKYLKLFNIS